MGSGARRPLSSTDGRLGRRHEALVIMILNPILAVLPRQWLQDNATWAYAPWLVFVVFRDPLACPSMAGGRNTRPQDRHPLQPISMVNERDKATRRYCVPAHILCVCRYVMLLAKLKYPCPSSAVL
jgi:hypothetical protein